MEGFRSQVARIGVGAFYDYQEMRKAQMNRIRDIVRKHEEGIPFDQPEPEKDKDEKSYGKWSDEETMKKLADLQNSGDLTTQEQNYIKRLLDAAEIARDMETHYKWFMQHYENEPLYQEFLQHVNGIGTILAANLIFRIGYCEDYDHVSNLWSHFGLDPQSPQLRRQGEQASYDRKLRTLAYKISDCLIRSNSQYREHFYDPYKKKQMRRMDGAELIEDEDRYTGTCTKCGQRSIDDGKDVDFPIYAGRQGRATITGFADRGDPLIEFSGDEPHLIVTRSTVEDHPLHTVADGDEVLVRVSRHLGNYLTGTIVATETEGSPPLESQIGQTVVRTVTGPVCATCFAQAEKEGWSLPSAPNSKGHAHIRSKRYMVKKFLQHYWYLAREMKNLEVSDPWIVQPYGGGHEPRPNSVENARYMLEEVLKD